MNSERMTVVVVVSTRVTWCVKTVHTCESSISINFLMCVYSWRTVQATRKLESTDVLLDSLIPDLGAADVGLGVVAHLFKVDLGARTPLDIKDVVVQTLHVDVAALLEFLDGWHLG